MVPSFAFLVFIQATILVFGHENSTVTTFRSNSSELQDPEQLEESAKVMFDEYWQIVLQDSPEYATVLGDHRYDDRLDTYSLKCYEKKKEAVTILFRAPVLRIPILFRAPVLRIPVLFRAPVLRIPVVFRAPVLRIPVVFRAPVLRIPVSFGFQCSGFQFRFGFILAPALQFPRLVFCPAPFRFWVCSSIVLPSELKKFSDLAVLRQ
ncbi:uncharacterized protein TNCT_246951 [Trichonephila clavata]|uniref:Uncharacterized protein n=1 Tax=Trichonephila clavata TaxID=2740835 RepID=A0A8X6ISS2_TRICU|nr:uncharacterized protein TNCT_246951 [Trichonephila clavata]